MVALTAAACTSHVPGTPDAEVVSPVLTPAADALPAPGQCTDSGVEVIACTEPHDAEVTEVGTLDLTAAEPTERDLRRAALPACRTALTRHLGSTDHDATRLQVRAFWPSAEGLARGDRWRLCAVTELAPDGTPKKRTSPTKDLLKAAGFATVQLCAEGSPAKEERPRFTACDGPHLAEAVPGVLELGKPTDPSPSRDFVDEKARQHCVTAVKGYVGADRGDVFASWRTYGSQGWSEGFTTAICYAEATRPFTGTLWGIGTKPLPG
ncbi:hypothetical protein GCM10022243_26820 [Saccharothrix violaceirubra]